jgi:hypothetical protein
MGRNVEDKRPLEERFMELVMPIPESGCWIWMGPIKDKARGDMAYGIFRAYFKKPQIRAHRFSYEFFNGKIINNLHVCHKCDIPLCVNPKHLFLGTHQDNIADRDRKGRQAIPRGNNNGMTKLFESERIEVQKSLESTRLLAAKYGVSKSCIKSARRGKSWTP